MAEAINSRNIGAYLQYLTGQLRQSLPAPYNNGAAFAGKSPAEIGAALEALYAQLGMPNQAGWSYEDAFLKEALTSPVIVHPQPLAMPAAPAYSYYPVAAAIGRNNYRPFLHYVEDRIKRPLELFGISAWDSYTDEGIRQALPEVYRSSGIRPDDARQLELGFLAVYHQKVAPVPVQMPVAQKNEPITPPSPPGYQTTTVKQVTPSRRRRWVMPVVLLLIAGAAGLWGWSRYSAFQKLPFVYALTNNIALRKDASDTSPVLGRMDIYGQYLDAKNVKQASASRLKLSTEELTNGFYKATSASTFWDYLTGKDSTLYVHTKYVTTDKALYDKYSSDLDNLQNDHNELDKLGFIYRQLIGRADLKGNDGAPLKIAASCRPSAKLSKVAPLSIAKYRNRATGELDVLIQATDGYCYVLRGGENELPPTITQATISYGTYTEPMKSGGMLSKTGSNGQVKFEYCSDGQVFFSQPPYTLFVPMPRPATTEPEDDGQDQGVPMDTVSTMGL